MNKPQEPLNDLELDRLLAAASSPPQIKGFEAKFLSRMASVHQAVVPHDNVVPFVRPIAINHKPARPVSRVIGIAAALAASLVSSTIAPWMPVAPNGHALVVEEPWSTCVSSCCS